MDLFDDPEFQSLIREFVGDLAYRRDAMRDARSNGDYDTVAHWAHKIVGCAGAYGFEELGDTARACETVIRESDDAERRDAAAAALDAEIDAVMQRSRAA